MGHLTSWLHLSQHSHMVNYAEDNELDYVTDNITFLTHYVSKVNDMTSLGGAGDNLVGLEVSVGFNKVNQSDQQQVKNNTRPYLLNLVWQKQ